MKAVTWFLFLSYCSVTQLLAQQQVSISWPSKQLLSGPIAVDKITPVHVVVSDVNNLLYRYEGWTTSVATPLPDVGFQVTKGIAPCDKFKASLKTISDQKTKWQLNPFIDEKGDKIKSPAAPASISLETTRTFYMDNVATPFTRLSQAEAKTCGVEDDWMNMDSANKDWLQRLAQPHTFTFDATLQPLNDYTFHIKEMAYDQDHNLQLTSACEASGKPTECTIQYSPPNDLLTVSGGFLFSELQSRTYQRTNVPSGSDAVLEVNNTGAINSLLTSLINVKLPCFWGKGSIPPCGQRGDEFGWALSIGPALQLGSGSAGVTRVGLFGGLSLHLWKYMYLTAGEHVGQFADFPTGFSYPGQTIPTSFTGSLTPVTRTSARMAFGVTLRGFKIPTGTSAAQGQAKTTNNTKQQ